MWLSLLPWSWELLGRTLNTREAATGAPTQVTHLGHPHHAACMMRHATGSLAVERATVMQMQATRLTAGRVQHGAYPASLDQIREQLPQALRVGQARPST